MNRLVRVPAAATCLVLAAMAYAELAAAQEPAPTLSAPNAGSEIPAAKPKPKPKPRPKPKPAPTTQTEPAKPSDPTGAETPETKNSGTENAGSSPHASGPIKPPAEKSAITNPPLEIPGPAPKPTDANAPPPPPAFAGPGVYCDPGQSVLFDGPQDFSFWVTRTGFVQIDNPLRPLTPEVTRVLQLVIAGKIATAYGPDYAALRRGGAPALVEGALGGAIRWDAKLGGLPDTLEIVSDSGETLAKMRFKECGEAPAAKALPVAAAKGRKRGASAPDPGSPETAATFGGPPPVARPPARRLPQGAIPE